jgi:tetratricopeptide (TPR) repeat protein
LRDLSRVCWAAGSLRDSRNYAAESLAIRRTLHDNFGLASTLAVLSWIAEQQGCLDEALQYAEERYAISQQIGGQEAIAQALFNLGTIHIAGGAFAKASARLEEASQVAQAVGNRHHWNSCNIWLSEAQVHQGRYRQAEITAQRALQTADEIGLRSHRGAALIRLATVHLIDHKHTEVMDCLTESLAIIRESRQSIKLPWVLTPLGYTVRALGNNRRARQHLQEILQLVYQQENVLAALYALPLAALLLIDKGELERAVEIYALAERHPIVTNSRWFADVAGQQIANAAALLSPEMVTAAQARGRGQELRQTVQTLLHQL